MSNYKPYRTIFIGDLVQETGLSTGGRDGDLYADAIMARDGKGSPVLRGSGLAGALLATLDDFRGTHRDDISRRLEGLGESETTTESLWLMHHAHLLTKKAQPMVRPNVVVHPWTGAAADGLYFSTEILPRGTRWRLIIETDDWRDHYVEKGEQAANRLLALALHEWEKGCCWLGRSPARGLGWARLENLQVFSLDSRAASFWPNADKDDERNIALLMAKAKKQKDSEQQDSCVEHKSTVDHLLGEFKPERLCAWKFYKGQISIGERTSKDEESYGLDSLSTLARDFPDDTAVMQSWFPQSVDLGDLGSPISHTIEPDSVPAWTRAPEPDAEDSAKDYEFIVPGSAIRGALRSGLSAWMRRADKTNGGSDKKSERSSDDPLLPMFGSIEHDSNLLISDARVVDNTPEIYLQDQHAEDEFTQGVYASAKFNRPCLISGKFEFDLAIRVRETVQPDSTTDKQPDHMGHTEQLGLRGQALHNTKNALKLADKLGSQRFLPIGGGVWRGHGWIELRIEPINERAQSCPAKDQAIAQEETT